MKTNVLLIFLICLAILLSSAFTVYLFVREASAVELPVFGKIADFQLINSQGDSFGLEELHGKVWVADFILTTCSTICPVMTKHMASLHRSYKLENDVSFVSFSVNPEHDTPEVFADYARRNVGDHAGWFFLTGERQDIRDLAVKSFKIGSIQDPIFHSGKFILVDRDARIRGYYEGTEYAEIKSLFKDLARLMKEK